MIQRIWTAKGFSVGIRIIVALIVGTLMACVECYDGISSIIAGQIWAVIVVGVSLILGVIFFVAPVRHLWNWKSICPGIILGVSMLLMLVGKQFGLGEEIIHPELGMPIVVLRSDVAMVCYLATIFSIVHWPGAHLDF